MHDGLLRLLATRFGHFRLESGHHGDLWLELDRLFLRPATIRPMAAELAGRLAVYDLAAVCGPLLGGALLAEMVAAELDIEFYYAERAPAGPTGILDSQNRPEPGEYPTHGLDDTRPRAAKPAGLYQVEYRLPSAMRSAARGKRVAVVDDAINAGSAVRATIAELHACGAQPVAAGALFVLGSAPALFAEQGLPLESLASLSSHVWAPADCPLCAAGIPMQDPAAE